MGKNLDSIEKTILKRQGFTDVHPETFPKRNRIYKRFREMSEKAGIEAPQLYVGHHRLPNAGMLSADKIIIADKLLEILNDDEMIAVLGHELIHVKYKEKHDALVFVSLPILAAGALMGDMAARKAMDYMTDSSEIPRRRFIKRVLGVSLGLTAGAAVAVPVMRMKEDEADVEGLTLSGDRDSFIKALEKIDNWKKENHASLGIISRIMHRSTPERTRQLP